MYKILQYNSNDFRIICTTDHNYSKQNYKEIFESSEEYLPVYSPEVEEKEQLRAKRLIREYILCNNFTYFFTSTVNSKFCDRFSLEECQSRIRRILKTLRSNDNTFQYIFITESHEQGGFHFHGVCTDLPLYINQNVYFSSSAFDTLGFNSFSLIKDKTKCANYITKYITKNCIKNEKGSIYFCSRGLKSPFSYEILPVDFNFLQKNLSSYKQKPFKENDYCKIFDFRLSDQNTDQLLFFRDYIKELPTLLDIIKKKLSKSEHF